ncbi:MAG: S49 family peptidase [Candidatus Methanoperedens sp.]|nr:S49 family peptidase [Candidatus Methanoperedens sp.]MCZ7368982.1 S49 family peptidase [Candidatus Methanoperedens sp.]
MQIREYAGKLSDSRPFLLVISVVVGIVLFNIFIGIPKVGIITLNTPFMAEDTKSDIVSMLKYAGDDPSIKAVVINMDSPGGEVSKIEEIYLETLKLRAKKPVVVSVDSSALSGGYYISSAANFIYVKPSSEIGNIGVISTLPEPWKPDSVQITTGPFKISGKSQKDYTAQVETIKQGFLMAVISQRGDKLHVDSERLSRAEIFLGSEGVKYGLADSLGTGSDAIRKAASMAGIANYDTLNINKAMNISFSGNFHGLAGLNKTVTPVNYYIYEETEES